MAEYDIDKILMVIFEEVRKMPGKNLKVKLGTIKQDLEDRFNDVMATLCEVDKRERDSEPLTRGRGNDTKIK